MRPLITRPCSSIRPLLLAAALACAALPLLPAAARARPALLKVKGFRPAAYVVPAGEGQRPVAVALHGNFDRPEWICGEMAELVKGRAWLLCPRGAPRKDVPREYDRWTFPSRRRLMAEIQAGLEALAARFPGRLAEGPPLLIGFSLGAIHSARFAVAAPKRFPRLYLVEGSHKVWTPKNIRRFAKGGGQAVLFGCGRRGCGAQSRRLCKALTQAGVRCAEATIPSLGHSYTQPLTGKALPLFNEMMADDPRWSGSAKPAAAPAAR
jgi:pimeloyl-ACP methyl ester carboxylesterase